MHIFCYVASSAGDRCDAVNLRGRSPHYMAHVFLQTYAPIRGYVCTITFKDIFCVLHGSCNSLGKRWSGEEENSVTKHVDEPDLRHLFRMLPINRRQIHSLNQRPDYYAITLHFSPKLWKNCGISA